MPNPTASLLNEKIWTTFGPEFGKGQGRQAVIVRVLYDLRSAEHIADCMHPLGYKFCLEPWSDPVTSSNIMLYVDGILMIHHDGEAALIHHDGEAP